MDYKTVLGIIAIAIGIAAYIPYFKSIFKGQTRPHMFSWFVWGLLQATGFFAQISNGGGAGSWVMGLTAFLCFSVFVISISRGEKKITTLDKLSFIGALLGIVLWVVTKNPLMAVILITIVDFLGFVPTYRKSFYKPFEETAAVYGTYFLVWILSLFALGAYNLTTVLYPASLILTNASFVTMILIRRRGIIKLR